MNKRQRKREDRFQRDKARLPKPAKVSRKTIKPMVNFPIPKITPFTFAPRMAFSIVGGFTHSYQLQIASRFPPKTSYYVDPTHNIDYIWENPRYIRAPRNPLSLKLLARNVLLKHRPHKDWVEFCSYPKYFRDQLINPLMIEIITPQLL